LTNSRVFSKFGVGKRGHKSMKTKIIILLLALTTSARATLLDLTPGGFHEGDFPPPFLHFIRQEIDHKLWFYDSMSAVPYTSNGHAYPPGWASQFGILNGGTYFFCRIDLSGPVPETTILWDFTGTDFFLIDVLVEGLTGDWANLYRVPHSLTGEGSVTIDGIINIGQIAFYGNNPNAPVPDNEFTLLLFGIAVAVLYPTRKTVAGLRHRTWFWRFGTGASKACFLPALRLDLRPRVRSHVHLHAYGDQ
jgi:hypothetical protein